MLLMIDNYDSFTYNLYQLLGEVNGQAPTVVCNDHPLSAIDLSCFDAVVISPGPGHPARAADFGISAQVIREAGLPVLGVCLGHQGICHLFGGEVAHAPEPRHGRISAIHHHGQDLFANLPSPFEVVRYHSLVATRLPDMLEAIAWSDDGLIMGLRHRSAPIWGVQFHPESICSQHGRTLLANFRDLALAYRGAQAASLNIHSFYPRNATTGKAPEPVIEQDSKSELPLSPSLVVERLDFLPDPEAAYLALYAGADWSFWLDSSELRPGLSRFSIMGDASGPLAERLSYRVSTGELTVERADGVERLQTGCFDYLAARLRGPRPQIPAGLPFEFDLGFVGYLGYELKAETGATAGHQSETPDAALLFVDRALVFDLAARQTYLLALAGADSEGWIDATKAQLADLPVAATEPAASPRLTGATDLACQWRHDRTAYLQRIDQCLAQIRDGESYEICLTNTATLPGRPDPLATYLRLRRISPVPFGALLRLGEWSVLSASPERFLQVSRAGEAMSKPIKGTRRRGVDAAEDAALVDELRHSEKERAENLMIVDLVRNDLNRVCEIGSVQVPVLFGIESYAPVHQMVSTISGRLRPDQSAIDCVRACFPGGSMTGAPKLRTLEIIDRLEAGPRGVYSGALGWFGLGGALDLSIVIRTLVIGPQQASFGVGGAITALSDPAEEFEETLIKARALLAALAQGQRQGST
ncbi:aminodeoxychorismate synthase component I [Chitinimonas lacunae]|uniref:aminodeoxychorismate synthase n=1 Tax=Chitinimonas lacunae TaxID=1963018 RepID=A0ABV8MUI6_9NEIS